MSRMFYDAKRNYESAEVPQELDGIIRSVIEENESKKKYRKVHFVRFAAVAACAVICFTAGVGYFFDFWETTNEAGTAAEVDVMSGARGIQRDAVTAEKSIAQDYNEKYFADNEKTSAKASVYNVAVQTKLVNSVNECLSLETDSEAYGEIQELYSDSEILSYSVTTQPSNNTNFYNIKQSDASDIKIESLVDSDSGYSTHNCVFYFKANDEVIIMQNGKETIIKVKIENED